MLYRSPEPAASWAVALVALGHLARRLTAGRDRRRGLGLVLLNLALPFVYAFVAVAILLIVLGGLSAVRVREPAA